MAKSQQTFNKIEKEKKKLKKREDKQKKKIERKANSNKGNGLDSMIAYVDENGYLTDTPPDPSKKKKIKAENIEIGVPKREKEEFDPVRKGKVAFFNDSKGYGFINDDETQERYFVHVNGLINEVKENDRVTFELERGQKGMNAVRVKKA
ncbi:cold-shock protein [Aquimarina muelleri]|uniref:Cold-shock protein n=1 Tax=Aquimarina muelleri TaxID=279356 RepID=A0A918JRL1_9FLAO|nr:cold shock domain-containing protein [Aquimarina muelleri]MCX2762044.1 cold shock domain-containing protein [Aquimarina muelleri]GGX04038.1 cold-shock protein [Aquimarina muelleri]